MRHYDNFNGVRAVDIDFGEGIRLVAVSHADEVEVVGQETLVRAGDLLIIAADTDRIADAREIIRSL